MHVFVVNIALTHKMDSKQKTLNETLNSFVELVQGKYSEDISNSKSEGTDRQQENNNNYRDEVEVNNLKEKNPHDKVEVNNLKEKNPHDEVEVNNLKEKNPNDELKVNNLKGRFYKRQQRTGCVGGISDCYSNSEGSENSMSDESSQSDNFSRAEVCMKQQSKEFPMRDQKTSSKASCRNEHKCCLDGGIRGSLISVDETWGLVEVGENVMHEFQSNVVFLYGLKLEGIPLQKVIHRDQSVLVYLKEEKVIRLEYGSPQKPNIIREAIILYCQNNSVPNDVKDILENNTDKMDA